MKDASRHPLLRYVRSPSLAALHDNRPQDKSPPSIRTKGSWCVGQTVALCSRWGSTHPARGKWHV